MGKWNLAHRAPKTVVGKQENNNNSNSKIKIIFFKKIVHVFIFTAIFLVLFACLQKWSIFDFTSLKKVNIFLALMRL